MHGLNSVFVLVVILAVPCVACDEAEDGGGADANLAPTGGAAGAGGGAGGSAPGDMGAGPGGTGGDGPVGGSIDLPPECDLAPAIVRCDLVVDGKLAFCEEASEVGSDAEAYIRQSCGVPVVEGESCLQSPRTLGYCKLPSGRVDYSYADDDPGGVGEATTARLCEQANGGRWCDL
jgi:hypothetical protein